MIGWSVELSEYNIKYEPQGPIKSQCLANFTSELQQCQELETTWTLHVDGSSSKKGGGARIVLEGPENIQVEKSLRFEFQTSNNQAEYEALIAGLLLARDVGARKIECKTDSQLMVGHINANYQIKDPLLLKYYHRVVNIISQFQSVKISHVKRQNNLRADTLSKLATAKMKGRHATVIQQTLSAPSVPVGECMVTEQGEEDWVSDMKKVNKDREEGKDGHDLSLAKKASRFVIIGEDLYKRAFSTPLLKCVSKAEAEYVLQELHQGACDLHYGAQTMATRVLRAEYYWPTLRTNCADFVKKCVCFQEHDPLIHLHPHNLQSISSPWPFALWGMDIIGPFPRATGQRKFLLVAIDYFTKWIEAEPLASITARQVQSFVWKDIVCRFGIPHTIFTDNGRQFTDRKLAKFYESLGIQHKTSSVEHPQTNDQAESANKVFLNELNKRLGSAKGKWVEQLVEVLWAYRCTPHSATGETPYNLTYGIDAMLPVEVGEPTIRRELHNLKINEECLRTELDLL
ncbi:uncharacterized protein [Phaseolus vulgaris]|uniref:uncharacterized protein n=1 Tax=Phaseolus vulgaris TaxID=3885 RepID=UPI0035CC44D6